MGPRLPGWAWALALALSACEPANEAERLALHWQACQSGLAPARELACTQVIEAPNADLGKRAQALVARGSLLAAQNQDVRAFSDFGQALRFDAANAGAYIQRGLLHQKRQAYGPAIADFDAAQRLNDGAAGQEYRADALAAEANLYRAQIQQLDAQIGRQVKSPGLYNARCWLRAIVGEELAGAMRDCMTALALAPATPEYLDSRGLVELKLHNYQGAFNDYDAAYTAHPDAHFLFGRGLARLGLGARAEGWADLQTARQTQPGLDGLYESYGMAPPSSAAPAPAKD